VIGNEKRGRPSIGVLDSGNHRLEVGETAGDDDGLFGAVDARDLRIQHPDDVQLEGCLHKLLSAKQISWAPRHVLLTKDALFFMLEAGGEIRDTIKLVDIASCSETESTHHANFLKDGDCAEKVNGKMSAMASAASFVGSSFKKTPSPSPKESKTKLTLAMELDRVLEIHTERYGRIYYLRAESVQNRNEWLHAINTAIEAAREKKKIENSLTPRRMWKLRLRRAVNSAPAQNMISLLLVVNFVINVYDSETNYPKGSSQRNFLDNVDNAFTVLYLLELLINMYVHWFRSFFTNGWFVFDFVVVMFNSIESLVLWMAQDDSGGLAVIRMVRIFRIVRLFNKLKSLQKVILGISSTLLPMSNIVIVFGIINSVYAILATRLFLDSYPQKFGSFVASSFTMFQVATGDSWVTDIVFTLNRNDEQSTTVVLLFFSSYVVIVGIILFNIIVAVLLEGFLGAIQKQERDEAAKEEKEAMQRVAGALDPLLATLAQFQSPQHLNAEIQMLFQLLDIDDSGSLTFSEVQIGLEDLPLTPQILLTKEDWWTLTADVVTLGDDEGMSLEAFTTAIRWQLMLYGQRMVGQHMKQVGPSILHLTLASL
jgi:voltage-gated sodium channel